MKKMLSGDVVAAGLPVLTVHTGPVFQRARAFPAMLPVLTARHLAPCGTAAGGGKREGDFFADLICNTVAFLFEAKDVQHGR